MRTLFKLDLLSRFGSTHKRGVRYRILQYSNYLFFAAVYALLVTGIYFLTKMFVIDSPLRMEFLVLVFTIAMALATIVSTTVVIKNLYLNGDNEMLLQFPVSGKEILASKSLYCMLHNLIVCFAIMLPFFISFGAVTNARVGDYFAYIGITLLASMFPYCLANIIAVPVMKVTNAVKNQFTLVLIITIIVVCGVFVFYLVSLSNVINYMRRSGQNMFSSGMIRHFRNFANGAYPFRFYAELLNGRIYSGLSSGQLALRFLYIFLITAALAVGAYFVTTREYYKTILYGVETQKAAFHKKIKDVQRPVGWAMYRREFYSILRSFSYSFQYFAMACAAPLMIFFCNRLAGSAGATGVGAAIMPGIMLMILIIFVTIVVSFASTSISREGNCFYHTKIIPVDFKTQVSIKFSLYLTIGTASTVLSCLLSGIYYTTKAGEYMMDATDIGCIFLIGEILVVGLTALYMILDIKSPTFNVGGDGELVSANKNTALAMIIGIAMAVIYGVLVMIFSFIPLKLGTWQITDYGGNIGPLYGILIGISLIFTGSTVAGLFVNIEKNYQKIAG